VRVGGVGGGGPGEEPGEEGRGGNYMSRTIKFLEKALDIAKKPEDIEFLIQLLFDIKKGK
jgi:hypothetical protein